MAQVRQCGDCGQWHNWGRGNCTTPDRDGKDARFCRKCGTGRYIGGGLCDNAECRHGRWQNHAARAAAAAALPSTAAASQPPTAAPPDAFEPAQTESAASSQPPTAAPPAAAAEPALQEPVTDDPVEARDALNFALEILASLPPEALTGVEFRAALQQICRLAGGQFYQTWIQLPD